MGGKFTKKGYNMLMIKIKSNTNGSVFLLALLSVIIFAGISTAAYIMFVKRSGNSHKTETYRGYKQGRCSDKKYEAWDGGGPSADTGRIGTECLTKSEIDQRETSFDNGEVLKPVIMLYSDKKIDFTVMPKFKVEKPFMYPMLNEGKGWRGTIKGGNDGSLIVGGREYNYLFWEGYTKADYDLSVGAVVPRDRTVSYLEKALAAYGLNARETGDFITFWVPKMYKNEYNLVSFVNQQYAAKHPITVKPTPDYQQRVFMVYKKADKNTQVKTQQTFEKQPKRHGFSVIEWGGKELP
jgi:hypothetical protein